MIPSRRGIRRIKFRVRIQGEDDIQERLREGFDEIRIIKQWTVAFKSVQESHIKMIITNNGSSSRGEIVLQVVPVITLRAQTVRPCTLSKQATRPKYITWRNGKFSLCSISKWGSCRTTYGCADLPRFTVKCF
jgi:hypothetical protein